MRTNVALQQPTATWTNKFMWDAAKRLTNVTSQAGSFTNEYFAGVAGASGYSSKLIKRLLLPNTSIITNDYDSSGRLLGTWLKTSGGTNLDSATYGYNTGNQRTSFTNAAGTYYLYTYDNVGQLKIATSSTASEKRGYTYDTAWNLNYRTNNGVLKKFKVDNKNQLTNAPGNIGWTYDDNGNRWYAGSVNEVFAYDDENRLVSFYQYDGQWNTNGLASTPADSRTGFVYDGLGRLRKQVQYSGSFTPPYTNWDVVSETRYIYDGMRVIQERDINNTPTVSYTRGNDLSGSLEGAGGIGGLLARSHGYSGGNWNTHNFYHADGNGNITYLVNSSQALAASYRYDPFGNTMSSSGTLASGNVYRFSSKEIVTAPLSGPIYSYGYRFYDPDQQRWINRDPIGETGGMNLYASVANDPVNRFDPFGEADAPKDKPPGTKPPIFPDDRFQAGIDNCLCYALDRPGSELQPDGQSGGKNAENCDDLKDQIKKNYKGVRGVPKSGNCPSGTHKIAVFSDEGSPGFHVQRQDAGGGWSEMSKGHGPGQTYPPRPCKKGKGPGTYCGDLCAPDQPR